jgi:tRNA pseudouridine32 synthase / 23S rRNA pseudouridine746 synthase
VHCAAMGWPIVGDNIYGTAPRFGGPVMHLHAREVVVPISKNKPAVRVVAPVPAHMRERLAMCGWNGAEDDTSESAKDVRAGASAPDLLPPCGGGGYGSR